MRLELSSDHSVARRFSRAAIAYQQHNVIQRQTQQQLCCGLAVGVGRLLDVGAGPGTDFSDYQPQQVIALDIATGMLQQLQQTYPHYQTVCADAQRLPLSSASVDSYYSNLALQWCADITLAAQEAHRVLCANGLLQIALVVADSLPELDDLGLNRRQFIDEQQLQAAFAANRWQQLQCETLNHQCHFADLRQLLYSIKGVGASLAAQQQGLKGKQHWQALQHQAEQLRQPAGIPLTYRVAYLRAIK
ncbi:methyltransferase domain-containing protein [Shewanella sp.]|uniref:methyltransferase domain-containing protein n=1 Tax=Shewanella sp. TaxID=50422 RepID=UPI003A97E500